MQLQWEDAYNDEEHRDQNASTNLVAHGYWSLGDEVSTWTIELLVQDEDLEVIGYRHSSRFKTEDEAKMHAQRIEDREDQA